MPQPGKQSPHRLTSRSMTAIWLAVCGVLATIGLFAPDGLTVAVMLVVPLVAVSLVVCNYLDRDGAIGLATVFLLGVTLRWVVATGVHMLVYQDSPGLFAPDELTYDLNAQLLLEYMRGHIPDPEVPNFAITWSMCGIYSVVGHLQMVPKLVNGLIGGWTAALTELIAARLFSSEVARRAGIIAAVTPSLVLWAALSTKDTTTLFGAQVALLAFMHLREKARPTMLLLALFGIFSVGSNRGYEVLFVVLPLFGSLLVTRGRHRARNAVFFVAFALLAVAIAQQTGAIEAIGGGDESALERLNSIREGYAVGAGSAMNINLVDTKTPAGLLLWVPIGLAYFLFAPIPFTGTSVLSSATSPEMLVWYLLLPSAVRGLRTALREKSREVAVLLLYAGLSSIGWAMVVTNVGTVYRYRSQMFFVIIIFIAVAQIRRKEERRRRDEEAVERVRSIVDAVRV